MYKKIFFFFVSILILSCNNTFAFEQHRLIIDNQLMPKSQSTYSENGYEYLNEDVLRKNLRICIWSVPEFKTLYISKDKNIISVTDENVYYNWRLTDIKVYPKVMDNKLFLPVAFVKLLNGYSVFFNDNYKFLGISSVSASVYSSVYIPLETGIINKYGDILSDSLKENGVFNNIDGVYSPDSPQKFAHLTFDDGPNPVVTPLILDILKQYNIKATFFMQGVCIQNHQSLVRRIAIEGHQIGNHTFSHKESMFSSFASFKSEVTKTNNLLESITGTIPKMFRTPYGYRLPSKFKSYLSNKGFEIYSWNVDSGDSRYINVSTGRIIKNIEVSVGKSKNVTILMHDGKGHINTANALRQIIKTLWEKGYGITPLTSH